MLQNVAVREESSDTTDKWELKELKPMHKQLCSLLAQGIDRGTIAKVLDITPEYVSMLTKQPAIQKYIQEMCQFASLQLEAQFSKGVEVIGEVMTSGNGKERLQAVRLNAELTHRIGSGSGLPAEIIDTNERLNRLATKLLSLQNPVVQIPVEGEFHEITRHEVQENSEPVRPSRQPTQENGNGSEDCRGQEG